jgi:hypothetical protein
VSACEPTGGSQSHTTPDREAPRKRKWIRRLPQIVKKSKHYAPKSSSALTDRTDSSIGLLALFGRRIAPTILIDIQEAPADIPSTGLREDPTNILATAVRDDPLEIPAIAALEDPTNSSPVATQDDSQEIPSSVAQDVPTDSSPIATQDDSPEIQEDPTNSSPVTAQEDVAAMPLTVPWNQIPPWAGYDIDW